VEKLDQCLSVYKENLQYTDWYGWRFSPYSRLSGVPESPYYGIASPVEKLDQCLSVYKENLQYTDWYGWRFSPYSPYLYITSQV